MKAKTMEGLVGASGNTNLINTPMRVFKEARRRGDTATMERAMGYASEFADRAVEYKAKAEEGTQEDAKEAREKAELEREEAIRKRKEEREEFEERIAESKDEAANTDTVQISEEGKVLLKGNRTSDHTGTDETKTDATKEPVTYTKTGETVPAKQDAGIVLSI